ncbi:MAG: methyl-accepting chemotaxis protein, partial [Gammaproteobacteria bacterium]
QQGAAASEELAATAEEMSGQAQQLQSLMAFFRTGDADAAAVRHTHTPPTPAKTRPAVRAARPTAAAATPTNADVEFVQF